MLTMFRKKMLIKKKVPKKIHNGALQTKQKKLNKTKTKKKKKMTSIKVSQLKEIIKGG